MQAVLPASILPGLLEIALRSRVNIQSLFDHAGIDAEAVGRTDRFITLAQLDTLLSHAFSEADDPFFGLLVGRENHYRNMDLLGNLMATADNLGEALRLLLVYKDLLVPYLSFELDVDGDAVTLASTSDHSLGFTRTRTHDDVVVATMVSIGRSLVGGDLALREVCLCHPAPENTAPYEAFFQVPVRYAQARNAVRMDSVILSAPLPTAYPKYHERLLRLADQQLGRLRRACGVSGQVTALIEQRLGQRDSGIDDVAGALNMTARTLQRRLRQEGVRFAALRDQVRHQHACETLQAEECDIEQLALALGFSDTANFYHAFRRWEGCAPGEFRRQARALSERGGDQESPE